MLAAIATLLIGVLVLSILVHPLLPHLELKSAWLLPRSADLRPKAPNVSLTRGDQKAQHAQAELKRALHDRSVAASPEAEQIKITQPVPLPASANPLTIGFYVNWDDSSYSSLNRNLN